MYLDTHDIFSHFITLKQRITRKKHQETIYRCRRLSILCRKTFLFFFYRVCKMDTIFVNISSFVALTLSCECVTHICMRRAQANKIRILY